MGSATLAANILHNVTEHAKRHLDADSEEMSLGEIVASQIRNGTITVDELKACAKKLTHPSHPDLCTSVDLTIVGHERFIFSSSRLHKAREEAIRRSRH